VVVPALALVHWLTSRPETAGPRQPRAQAADPPVVVDLRAQLSLGPVLAAEAALRTNPDDPAARERLAESCARGGDPVGAALALYPLVEATHSSAPGVASLLSPSADRIDRYFRACLQIGWLGEADAALQRLPAPSARARLDLAAADAAHGEASRAVGLLERLGRERLAAGNWLDGAITWYHCRRLERAVQWAQAGAAKDPGSPAGPAVLARCMLAAGQPQAALRALSVHPLTPSLPHSLIAYWRARAQVRCRDASSRRAGQESLARLATASDDAAAAFEAGRSFLLASEASRAVPLLSRAAVSRYQEVLGYELLSQAYAKLGRRSEALWALGRAQTDRGQFAEAAVSLQQCLELDPHRPMAWVDQARALDADGRPREALAVLEHAEEAVGETVDVHLLEAKLLLHLERVPDVIRELSAAAKLDPKRANEPLGNLGTVFYDSQQFDRAIPVLEQAVQREDGDAHSHFYLGRTYARQVEDPARAEKALYHLLRAARMQPDFSRPWMAAAAVLQRMGYLAEAAACLRHAIAGECQSDAPYVRLGQLLQLQGRLPERRLILQQYGATRDHDLRRTGLEKQTRDDPKDAARRFALGDMLLREGHPDKALPELLAATGLRPGWKAAAARLADACALLDFDDMRAEAEREAR
jgi:tetratricopeptide (TPR) repeat protein